jgi:putative drug exporter of the RND superfamily
MRPGLSCPLLLPHCCHDMRTLTSTAGIITSAVAVIIVVTDAFAFSSVIVTKAVGSGLAVAVFVDATIIRVLLVPATMRVLGDWSWWPGGRTSTFGNKRHRSPRTLRRAS